MQRSGRWLALFIVLSGLAPARAQQGGQPDYQPFVRAWLRSEARVMLRAEVTMTEPVTGGGLVSVKARLWRRDGQRSYRVLNGGEACRGVRASELGAVSTVYVPGENTVYRRELPGRRVPQWLALLRTVAQLGEFERLADDRVAGRQTYHLRASLPSMNRRFDIWVDQRQLVMLRIRCYRESQLLRALTYDFVNYGAKVTADDITNAVKGAKRVDIDGDQPATGFASAHDLRKKTGIRLMAPRRLPPGYQLRALRASPPRAVEPFVRRVTLHYRDAHQNLLMIAMGRVPALLGQAEPEPPATPTQVRPGVFTWRRDDVRLALIGPAESDSSQLQACAESVDWYDK